MINSYPIGLLARTQYFRVLKSIWTQEVKDFVITRMVASANNIKPVIVIDDATKISECFMINRAMDTFELVTGFEATRHCRRVEAIADYHINKVKAQKSRISVTEKEKVCFCLETRDFYHGTLSIKDRSELGYALRDTTDTTKYERLLSDVNLTATLTDIQPKPSEAELLALDGLPIAQFRTELEALKQLYPVYADEIEDQLRRRGIEPSR